MEKNISFYLFIFFISSLGLIPFIPSFRAIDMVAPQYLFLSLLQSIILIFLFIKRAKILFNYIDLAFLSFLIVSLFSFYKSFNIQESIIAWSRYLTLFITYFNLKVLFINVGNKRGSIILYIIGILLFLESGYILLSFINNYNYEDGLGRIRELQGFSSNLNIGAFSILIKLPFIIYFTRVSKSLIKKTLLFSLIFITTFNILIIASRGAILALLISLAIFLVLDYYLNKNKFLKNNITLIALVILSFSVQNFLYQNNESLKTVNRISSYSDKSVGDRLEYYKESYNLFKENPFIGIGIGNWKIQSLKNYSKKIIEYTVPFHAHNDFLQILSETGILGINTFLLIFLIPFFIISKKIFNKERSATFYVPFLIALIIFFIDPNLNFPRLRPYSQMNILYLLSFLSSGILNKTIKLNIKTRHVLIIIFLLLIPLNYIHSRILMSYKEIFNLYYDFNLNNQDLQLPIKMIKEYEDNLPNITNTTIPIKLTKANYYLQNKDFKKAKDLIKQGVKVNPYLGFGDFLMAKILYEEQKKDSALFYIEKAYQKVPFNSAHIVLYQTILNDFNLFNKEHEIFEKIKYKNKNKLVWTNHFFILARDSTKLSSNNFSTSDKENIKLAKNYFPNEKLFDSFDLIINKGAGASKIASYFDEKAKIFYKEKKYNEAISNWEEAIKIISNEDSYILNIAMALCQQERYDEAIDRLKLIETKSIKSDDGFFEFIAGYAFLGKNELKLACKYLRGARIKGYELSFQLLKKINCQN